MAETHSFYFLIKMTTTLNDKIRLTELIHKFVRNELNWNESLMLLDEIVESEEWMRHLEMDQMLYNLAVNRRNKIQYMHLN